MRRICSIFLTLLACPYCFFDEAVAQARSGSEQIDRIFVTPVVSKQFDPWQPPETEQHLGKIEDFDEKRLVLVAADGQKLTLASDRVADISINWATEAARAASQLVAERRHREAITAIQAAYRDGPPRWQQRILIGQLVQSLSAIGQTKSAGVIFLNLVAAKPPAMLYADMPLCWKTTEPSRELTAAAKQWIASDDSAARLLGASWLLLGPDKPVAQSTLERLLKSQNMAIASLAEAQLWRLVPPPQSQERLGIWFSARDRLLPPLQLGPTEFIADRLSRLGRTQLAVGQWMRITSNHSKRYHRAHLAAEAAEQQLRAAGQIAEAQRLQSWISGSEN